MEWTKTRPTQPGFYFLAMAGLPEPTVVKVVVAPGLPRIYCGHTLLLDFDESTCFAGPIPLPEQHEAKSCYDCKHCQLLAPSGHNCIAPVPAWVHGEANDNIPIIEDPAAHDATMAEHCELFQRRRS